MARIRVLHIIGGLDPAAGGPPECAVATALSLRRAGVVVDVAFTVDRGHEEETAPNVERLRSAETGVHPFPTTPIAIGKRWSMSPALAMWLIRHTRDYDVIHVHGAWTFTAVAGLFATRLRRRVAVLTTHGSLTDFDRAKSGAASRGVKRSLRAVYLRAFDRVVVASKLEQRDSGDPHGQRTVVIPHVVNGLATKRAGQQVKAGGGPLRVGFLGRLHATKNLEIVIEALGTIDGATLTIAGDGSPEYREELRRLVRRKGLDRRVTWLGFVDAEGKEEFFSSIDLLAMPSAYECFGVAAVEALNAGIPVLVSPTVGIAETVARRTCGIVVPARSDAVARALSVVVDDAGHLERLRSATRAAGAEFTSEQHGRLLRDEYLLLLHRASPRSLAPKTRP